MDIYLLEKGTYQRIDIIDNHKSFIWTERMSSPGDCELVLAPSPQWNKLTLNRLITHSETREAMIIEERHETTDEQGETVLTIRGRSLDTMLERRSVIPPSGKETWGNYGPIWEAIYNLVGDFALSNTGLGGANDKIPDLYRYMNTKDETPYDTAVGIQDLYSAIKDLADSEELTFGIDLNPTSPRLRFYTIKGQLRQIFFSTKLDTLSDPSFLHTNAEHYNVAYVWSSQGRYRTSVGSTNLKGINRRVLTVNATDLDVDEDTSVAKLKSQLKQRGREELSKHKEQRIFDGKLTGVDPYVYRTHYNLGDMVTLIDSNNNQRRVRISEYIFAEDQEGYRNYPTFTTVE